jgi:hypothetical protein
LDLGLKCGEAIPLPATANNENQEKIDSRDGLALLGHFKTNGGYCVLFVGSGTVFLLCKLDTKFAYPLGFFHFFSSLYKPLEHLLEDLSSIFFDIF